MKTFVFILALLIAIAVADIQFKAKIPVSIDDYVCLVKEVPYDADSHITGMIHPYDEEYVHHALMLHVHEDSTIFNTGELFSPDKELGFGKDGTMSFLCPQIGTSTSGVLGTIAYRISSINAWERNMRENVEFPHDVGFRLGPTYGRKWIVAQYHIHVGGHHGAMHTRSEDDDDNEKTKIKTTIKTTTSLRPYDAASLLMIVPDEFITIPANSIEHEVSVSTDPIPYNNPCYGPSLPFPVHPITTFTLTGVPAARMFHSHLHTHSNGKRINLEVIRGGDTLPVDVSYRQAGDFHPLHEVDFGILPTDQLKLSCTYSTIGRNHTVVGGLRSQDEMCILFSLVYPAGPLNYSDLSWCNIEVNNTPFTNGLTHCGATPAPCWKWWL